MKANELMIGDWVIFPCGNEKIIDLLYVPGKGICASFAASATLFPVEVEKLRPIPLTPEILEKNGFESDNNMFGMCDYELSESYILENRGNRFCFVKRISSHSGVFYIIDVKYIHELQHALRLCGINKEIII